MAKTGEFVLFVRKRKKKHAAGDAMKAKRFLTKLDRKEKV